MSEPANEESSDAMAVQMEFKRCWISPASGPAHQGFLSTIRRTLVRSAAIRSRGWLNQELVITGYSLAGS